MIEDDWEGGCGNEKNQPLGGRWKRAKPFECKPDTDQMGEINPVRIARDDARESFPYAVSGFTELRYGAAQQRANDPAHGNSRHSEEETADSQQG